MKKFIVVLMIGLLSACGESEFNDERTKELLWIEKGKDAVKATLKDPSSAEFGEVYFSRGMNDVPVSCGKVSAKNSFGVFKTQKFISAGSSSNTYLQQDVEDFTSLWAQFCVPNNAPEDASATKVYFNSDNDEASAQLIPRTVAGDKGKYYLLEQSRKGDVVTVSHKRVGPSGAGFSKTQINCNTKLVLDVAYGEDSIENMNPVKGGKNWYELVEGSSKADLALFVCK